MKTFEYYQTTVENALNDSLGDNHSLNSELMAAMRYSLLAGGKRLRPVLLLMAAEYLNVELGQALPYACAIEMIHTYSLIHDDLPAMDNDVLRRGKPTNHVVNGEAMAILAGDGLLSRAFELAIEKALLSGPKMHLHLRAISELAKAAGVNGMVAGQSLDIFCEKHPEQDDTANKLKYIQENKTAAMIRGALLAGLSLGNPTPQAYEAFSEFGLNLGIAFQIADDILDIESNNCAMGKSIGKDEKSGKLTQPSLYGLAQAKLDLETYSGQAVGAISKLENSDVFVDLANALIKRVC